MMKNHKMLVKGLVLTGLFNYQLQARVEAVTNAPLATVAAQPVEKTPATPVKRRKNKKATQPTKLRRLAKLGTLSAITVGTATAIYKLGQELLSTPKNPLQDPQPQQPQMPYFSAPVAPKSKPSASKSLTLEQLAAQKLAQTQAKISEYQQRLNHFFDSHFELQAFYELTAEIGLFFEQCNGEFEVQLIELSTTLSLAKDLAPLFFEFQNGNNDSNLNTFLIRGQSILQGLLEDDLIEFPLAQKLQQVLDNLHQRQLLQIEAEKIILNEQQSRRALEADAVDAICKIEVLKETCCPKVTPPVVRPPTSPTEFEIREQARRNLVIQRAETRRQQEKQREEREMQALQKREAARRHALSQSVEFSSTWEQRADGKWYRKANLVS